MSEKLGAGVVWLSLISFVAGTIGVFSLIKPGPEELLAITMIASGCYVSGYSLGEYNSRGEN